MGISTEKNYKLKDFCYGKDNLSQRNTIELQ
ncbi:Uncharacterised protein [Sphingobacterium multivorum]|uniref:Uncharacterized protein n=1 Tax=Sphingobacterium multivorum TaxID=28454 RepID=A0A2X2JJU7_SPHMU|nr:Uncharacterised protein [Sphingobacterium multivorum]